jgi:hypothetical protein
VDDEGAVSVGRMLVFLQRLFGIVNRELTAILRTRDFRPPKPDPAGILHIAKSWGLTKGEEADGTGLIMVGYALSTLSTVLRFGNCLVSRERERNLKLTFPTGTQ